MFRKAFPGQAELIDLASRRLRPFTYQRVEGEDDFEGIVQRMLAHRQILMATPVYWYAMSGIMKAFFDRLTDLLTGNDPTRRGRALAGRKLWLLAVGTDPHLPEGFEVPFESTARYLEMEWGGSCYCRTTGEGLAEHAETAIRDLCAAVSR